MSINTCAIYVVRVKGGMSLWNGMWHDLRNGIIMRNTMKAESDAILQTKNSDPKTLSQTELLENHALDSGTRLTLK